MITNILIITLISLVSAIIYGIYLDKKKKNNLGEEEINYIVSLFQEEFEIPQEKIHKIKTELYEKYLKK